MLFDGEWQEYDHGLTSTDPLKFTDTKPYHKRLDASIAATGLNDAVITATGRINGIETVVAAMEYSFIGGSMGVVVGEKITRAIERAIAGRLPVIIVSCSGGARMMEGALSLMQMAKISARAGPARPRAAALHLGADRSDDRRRDRQLRDARRRQHRRAEGAHRLRRPARHRADDPAELPEGFQRSEFLLEHGMLDIVVDRREMKDMITRVLRFGVRPGGGAGADARRPEPAAQSAVGARRRAEPPSRAT